MEFPAFSLTDISYTGQLQSDGLLFKEFEKKPVPQAYVVNENFNWTSKRAPTAILYGNQEIGYFSSKNFSLEKEQLKFKFIPPTYRQPLIFSALTPDGKKIKLASKKYKNPFAPYTEGLTQVQGTATFPFILMNGTTRSIPTVMNSLGEIVWMYKSPMASASNGLNDTTAIEIIEGGEFMFLYLNASTRLMWMDSFGNMKRDIDFREKKIPYPSTHTVQYMKKTNEILFLSHDCRMLSWWSEFIPLFQGPLGWWRLMTLPRRSYNGSKLLRMSLDTLKVTEIWNTYRDYSPSKNPSLAAGMLATADRFIDAKTEEQYRHFLTEKDYATWNNWPDSYCNVDWTHENSAQYIEDKGYLVSVRNLNELIFLDEQGNKKWNIGEGAGHTYNIPVDGSAFSLQHSAAFQSDGTILLYDNHIPYRGFSGWRMANRILLLNPKVPGPLRPIWHFDLLSAMSDIRGSVTLLPDKYIFAYSAGNPGVPSDFFEVDMKTSKSGWRLRYSMLQGNKGFEAKPFWSFAGDTYLGMEDKTKPSLKNPTPSKNEAPSEKDFLQFSY